MVPLGCPSVDVGLAESEHLQVGAEVLGGFADPVHAVVPDGGRGAGVAGSHDREDLMDVLVERPGGQGMGGLAGVRR